MLIGHLVKSDSQTRGLKVRRRKKEGRGLRTEGVRRKAENCSKGNALDKHIVFFVNEKYYVSSYKLLRLIIELRVNWIKIRSSPAEIS